MTLTEPLWAAFVEIGPTAFPPRDDALGLPGAPRRRPHRGLTGERVRRRQPLP
jgi:hypothetical protein